MQTKLQSGIYMVALANAYADRKNPNTNKPPEQRYVSPDALMDATEVRAYSEWNMPSSHHIRIIPSSLATFFSSKFRAGSIARACPEISQVQ